MGMFNTKKPVPANFLLDSWWPMLTAFGNVDGCILGGGGGPNEREARKMLAGGSSRKEVESFLNHHHMSDDLDLLGIRNSSTHRKRMAILIQGVLRVRLEKEFPDRQFVVEVTERPEDTDVTFYQRENDPGDK